jgi:hypothetical protein
MLYLGMYKPGGYNRSTTDNRLIITANRIIAFESGYKKLQTTYDKAVSGFRG